MTHEQERSGGESHDEPRPENELQERPRIYVASLADYNAGRLHGTWIDADQEPEQLTDAVAAMLRRSPEPGAEEWAIHDYEGFGPLRLSEYDSLEHVAEIAKGITEHGPAFAHWVALSEPAEADPKDFEALYLGHFSSVEEYAQHLLADLGVEDEVEQAISKNLRPYVRIDYEGFVRDLQLGGDIEASEGDGGVYIFGTQ